MAQPWFEVWFTASANRDQRQSKRSAQPMGTPFPSPGRTTSPDIFSGDLLQEASSARGPATGHVGMS